MARCDVTSPEYDKNQTHSARKNVLYARKMKSKRRTVQTQASGILHNSLNINHRAEDVERITAAATRLAFEVGSKKIQNSSKIQKISTKFTVIIGVIVFVNILIINCEITNRHLTSTYFYALFFYRVHVKAVKNITFAVAIL